MSITYLDLSNYKNTLQLESENHLAESAVSLTDKQKLSLYKKSQKSGYSTDILEEVYRRGHMIWKAELFEGTREQFAFDRVNSFISGGFALDLDSDLIEKEVWDKPNPVKKHKKLSPAKKSAAKARAKAAGRPYPNMIDNMWAARNEEYTGSEKVSKNKNKASSRFDGTKSVKRIYQKDTPGQPVTETTINTIRRVVEENKKLDEDLNALLKANPQIKNKNVIIPGQEINLPTGGKYKVSAGDNLSNIASGKYKGEAPKAAASAPSLSGTSGIPPYTPSGQKPSSAEEMGMFLSKTPTPAPDVDLSNRNLRQIAKDDELKSQRAQDQNTEAQRKINAQNNRNAPVGSMPGSAPKPSVVSEPDKSSSGPAVDSPKEPYTPSQALQNRITGAKIAKAPSIEGPVGPGSGREIIRRPDIMSPDARKAAGLDEPEVQPMSKGEFDLKKKLIQQEFQQKDTERQQIAAGKSQRFSPTGPEKNTSIVDMVDSQLDKLRKPLVKMGIISPSNLRNEEAVPRPPAKVPYATIKSAQGPKVDIDINVAKPFQNLIDYTDKSGKKIDDLSGLRVGSTIIDPLTGADTKIPSTHATGKSLDINPEDNPHVTNRQWTKAAKTSLPKDLIDFAKSQGLGWGGEWKGSKDPMHFSSRPYEGGIYNSDGSVNKNALEKNKSVENEKSMRASEYTGDDSSTKNFNLKGISMSKAQGKTGADLPLEIGGNMSKSEIETRAKETRGLGTKMSTGKDLAPKQSLAPPRPPADIPTPKPAVEKAQPKNSNQNDEFKDFLAKNNWSGSHTKVGDVFTHNGKSTTIKSGEGPFQAFERLKSMKESKINIIKKVISEQPQICEDCDCQLKEELLVERGADSKGYFRSTESGAGLTAKGAKHFGVKTAVTEKDPGPKRAARRRSFCARMSGMKGPMKDEKGRPTRKAMSLRRWRC